MRSGLLTELLNFLLISLGVLSAGFGLNGFLLSSNFIDGGVTGVSMLLSKITFIPLSIWLPLVNLPFIVIGYLHLSRTFAVRSILATSGLAAVLATVPFPDVTPDLVLTAVFGGFFIGAGIGLSIRGGAALDGTDLGALLISKRFRLFRVGDVILGFNVLLFLSAIAVLGFEAALYSILTYITAAKTLNFVLYGLEEYTAITIVSDHSMEIRRALTRDLGRGVTVFRGKGGFSDSEQDILYCVVTRLEIPRLRAIVHELDANAFITFNSLADVEGGVVKKRGVH